MPWFKVDDTLHSHPKHRRAGMAAVGLWATCGSYAMAYKTNGFVPDWFVASLPGGRKHSAALIRAGLWFEGDRNGEQGYVFHDWEDYQPSADEIERERELSRERQRKRRQRLREGGASA